MSCILLSKNVDFLLLIHDEKTIELYITNRGKLDKSTQITSSIYKKIIEIKGSDSID